MTPPVPRSVRTLLGALPAPGWGGTTLAGYTETIGMRPELTASQAECQQFLDGLVAKGYAQTVGDGRWEQTPAAHDIVTGVELADEALTPQAVMLDLQPGVVVSGTSGEAQA